MAPLFDPARALLRAQLKAILRDYFSQRGALEIDTPLAVVCPGTEVHLGYFATTWRDHMGQAHPLFLRSSPELHMKQALAYVEGAQAQAGLFQLATCFRNDGELSPWHHPEFTMLEWYQAGVCFSDFIRQTEDLLRETQARLRPQVKKLLGRELSVLPERLSCLSVADAFREFAGLELIDQDADLAVKAREKGVLSPRAEDDFETAFFKILIEKIEPGLAALGAAVLCDYPASQAALAMVQSVDGTFVAKRFEIYVGRVELCNGFEELLDPLLNRQRIHQSNMQRRQLGHQLIAEDLDFYAALERGVPACCGNALGFDRWLALLMGDLTIDGAIPFRAARHWRDQL